MNARPMLIAGAIIVSLMIRTARAEQLVLIPSTTEVLIRSNYVGASVALFGAVQDQAGLAQEDPVYDVVITVIGPRQTLVAQRKGRFLGIWANAESRTFADVPSYLEVLANRPLDAIAGDRVSSRSTESGCSTRCRQVRQVVTRRFARLLSASKANRATMLRKLMQSPSSRRRCFAP